DDELLGVTAPASAEADAATAKNIVSEAAALGLSEGRVDGTMDSSAAEDDLLVSELPVNLGAASGNGFNPGYVPPTAADLIAYNSNPRPANASFLSRDLESAAAVALAQEVAAAPAVAAAAPAPAPVYKPTFT